jgi:hypothetical protein
MKQLLPFLFLAASSAQALQYQCTERASDAFKNGRLQYAVVIAVVAQTRVSARDSERVRVSLLKRDPRDGASPFTPMRPVFDAEATTEGSVLRIEAMQRHGLRFEAPLSPLDEGAMELRWVRGAIRLRCKAS